MKAKTILNKLNQLEDQIKNELVKLINKSNNISKYHNNKSIKVNIFGYTELTIIDGDLYFTDGKHIYTLFADCDLYDLIQIINENEK
jgi:hypothetical protein